MIVMKRKFVQALFISFLLASLLIANLRFMPHRSDAAMPVVAKREVQSDAVGRKDGFLICEKDKISLRSWQDAHVIWSVAMPTSSFAYDSWHYFSDEDYVSAAGYETDADGTTFGYGDHFSNPLFSLSRDGHYLATLSRRSTHALLQIWYNGQPAGKHLLPISATVTSCQLAINDAGQTIINAPYALHRGHVYSHLLAFHRQRQIGETAALIDTTLTLDGKMVVRSNAGERGRDAFFTLSLNHGIQLQALQAIPATAASLPYRPPGIDELVDPDSWLLQENSNHQRYLYQPASKSSWMLPVNLQPYRVLGSTVSSDGRFVVVLLTDVKPDARVNQNTHRWTARVLRCERNSTRHSMIELTINDAPDKYTYFLHLSPDGKNLVIIYGEDHAIPIFAELYTFQWPSAGQTSKNITRLEASRTITAPLRL